MGAKSKQKLFSYSAGERGRNRVRVYEDASGQFFIEYYVRELGASTPRRKRESLKHRDQLRAKRQAEEVAAAFGKSERPPTPEPTLRELFDIYLREVTPTKGESKRQHDHRCAEMFLRFFGQHRKAPTLSRRDWDRFIRERGEGRIAPKGSTEGREVGARQIGYDLRFLLAVLRWAVDSGDG